MNPEVVAEEARQRRRRSLQGLATLALWAAGGYLLYLASGFASGLAPPLNDALSTAVYLITFFYIFALWPIQSLVERLLGRGRRHPTGDQKP